MGGKPSSGSKGKPTSKPSQVPSDGGKSGNAVNTGMKITILLLGSGDSGKSTFFKQLKTFVTPHFTLTDEEVSNSRQNIYANLVQCIRCISLECFKHDPPFANPDNVAKAKKIMELPGDAEWLNQSDSLFTEEVYKLLKDIWNDANFQANYVKKDRYHIFDGSPYFFSDENYSRLTPVPMREQVFDDGIQKLKKKVPNYVPTVPDTIRTRMKTVGLVQVNTMKDGVEFKIFDVGGQRSERKKWANIFKDVNCILYVVATSEFDQMCYEDDTTNRMKESLELFTSTINIDTFVNTPIILFFNKIDIFQRKITSGMSDLSQTFPEYTGGKDVDAALNFISNLYVSNIKKGDKGRVKILKASAMDVESVKTTFAEVQQFAISFYKSKH